MLQDTALTILKTGGNVFLTGEPGSGKTHTVNQYVAWLRSHGIEPAITASTGIAATHIGGMTIHSWSGISIKSRLTAYDLDKIAGNERVVKRIKNSRVLVIDEISMLPPGTISMVEMVCREILQNPLPFGGLQIVFVGDFFQLPPIVKRETENDESLFSDIDEAPRKLFAYQSPAWAKANPIVCYLTEQHRQDDADFLELLSAIRKNEFGPQHFRHIQKRRVEHAQIPQNVPKLFSHNADVDRINTETLGKIPSAAQMFPMTSEGPAPLVETLMKNCLSPDMLSLKVGASVMFTKNSLKDGFVNGTLGTVQRFSQNGYPVVRTRSGREIEVMPMDWNMEENGRVRAKVTQVPLRLAWAITVHKSQGMSLDEAVMDLSDVFEYGQGYVALSRVRRLSGLHMLGWNQRTFQVHPDVLADDVNFRMRSQEAEETFNLMPEKELAQMHERFIKAAGGNVAVVDTTPHISARTDVRRNAPGKNTEGNQNPYSKIREKYPSAYQRWSKEDDEQLLKLFSQKLSVAEIAKRFGRKSGAVRSRLMKMGLLENYFAKKAAKKKHS